ncbi:MAG: ABC transporter permease [Acutalibacteraceae bacterium]
MTAILKRELGSFFHSAIGYIVLAVFYAFAGLFFYLYCLYSNSASLTNVFGNMFLIILFVVPIITMKSFSEERKQKTEQALLTSPASIFQIVMGKFLGAFVMYCICIAIFLVFALVICFFTTPQWSVVIGNFVGVLLLGAALIAIDIFISSLTESQVISAVVGVAAGLVIYMLDSLASLVTVDFISTIISSISFLPHYTNFTNGIFSLADIVFFASVVGIFLFLTVRVFEKKRWS